MDYDTTVRLIRIEQKVDYLINLLTTEEKEDGTKEGVEERDDPEV